MTLPPSSTTAIPVRPHSVPLPSPSHPPTGWFPTCYTSFQNILPAPITILSENGTQGVFIAPDSVSFLSLLGPAFTSFFAPNGTAPFNWQRLAGARVLQINAQDPLAYIDRIARTVSGNYLDHGVRVNSVLTSYRISGTDFSQRLGDFAGPISVEAREVRMRVIVAGEESPEDVAVPFVASYTGAPFVDRESL